MNKDLIIKNKELQEEEHLLYYTISRIKEVLENSSFYQKTESKKALEIIKEYLQEKQKRLSQLEQEQKLNQKKLRETCKHEIILKTDLNTNCVICNRLFINPPTNQHLLLEYDGSLTPSFYKDIDDTIIEIATNGINTFEEFENQIAKKIKQIRTYRRK